MDYDERGESEGVVRQRKCDSIRQRRRSAPIVGGAQSSSPSDTITVLG
jgi:hypothetical protein